MLPAKKAGKRVWRMIEVKSATSIKDYHRDDIAVQAFIARNAGVPLDAITLAHIDSGWIYPGGEDYQGLLAEHDLSAEAFAREEEVRDWIAAAQAIVRKRTEPAIRTGRQYTENYECGFLSYCQNQECQNQQPQAKYPVDWLPRIQTKALKTLIEKQGVSDMRDIPDTLLNEAQLRVKNHTQSGLVYFDATGAAKHWPHTNSRPIS